jgi:SAM-dependent methyltransferase
MSNHEGDADRSILEEDTDKVNRIHDAIAQYWNWAYYDDPCQVEASWLLGECMKSIKSDVEPRAVAALAEIDDYLKQYPRNSLSVVDIGCGPGGFIRKTISHFAEKHPEIRLDICGLDISKEMINFAKAHLSRQNVELICDNITNPALKLKKEPFDLGLMVYILPWYSDESAISILRAARQRLKKDGTLILEDFSLSYSPWRGLNFYSKTMDKMANMLWTTVLGERFQLQKRYPDQIEALLKDAGFEMVTCYPTEKKKIKKGMLVIRARVKPSEVATEVVIPEERCVAEIP